MVERASLKAFLDPGQSASVVADLVSQWQDNQRLELEAVLFLLAQHPDPFVRHEGAVAADALAALPEPAQRHLVSLPPVPSWQQCAAVVAAQNPDTQSLVAGTGFALEQIRSFLLATAIRFAIPLDLDVEWPVNHNESLPGTGLHLTSAAGMRVRFDGATLHMGSHRVSLAELPKRAEPWSEPAAKGDSWCIWQNPVLRHYLEVEPRHPLLIVPFEHESRFLPSTGGRLEGLGVCFEAVLDLLDQIWPEMAREMALTDQAVLWVTNAVNPDEINSFSDNSVPGALYLSMTQRDGLLPPEEILDSLVHEHLHQKLYLLEAASPIYDPMPSQLFHSPWRVDPRPIGGIFHGYFVFYGLRSLWGRALATPTLRGYAERRLSQIEFQLADARTLLTQVNPFTETGALLFDLMGEFAP